MRKATIICTLGPASNTKEKIKELVEAGLGGARINFSHGDHTTHGETIDNVKAVAKDLEKNIPIILDTKGPEIRTLVVKGDNVELTKGQKFIFTTEEVEGDVNRVGVTYEGLTKDLSVGDRVFVDDGLIGMKVEKIEGTEVICTVENTGMLGSRKGINLPDTVVKLPVLTEKDKADLKFGVEKEVDYIFASFVRNAEDVKEIRRVLDGYGGKNIEIISKIENREGIDKMDEIIKETDGVCVARGDLGIEIPVEEIPEAQKTLISRCNEAGVFCIVATQMLESMITNPRPTRAEICDVSNAITDGANTVMLSGETAKGSYPVEAVKTMAKIIARTELNIDYKEFGIKKASDQIKNNKIEIVAQGLSAMAKNERVKVIVIRSNSTEELKIVARLKPDAKILVITENEEVARKSNIIWGTKAIIGTDVREDIVRKMYSLKSDDIFLTLKDLKILT